MKALSWQQTVSSYTGVAGALLMCSAVFGVCYSEYTVGPACNIVCGEEDACQLDPPEYAANETVTLTYSDSNSFKNRKLWDFACDVIWIEQDVNGICNVVMTCTQDVTGIRANGLCEQQPPA